jgi:hypothetical protein
MSICSGTDKNPRKNLTDSAGQRSFWMRADFQSSSPAFTYAEYKVVRMNAVRFFLKFTCQYCEALFCVCSFARTTNSYSDIKERKAELHALLGFR